MLRLTLEDIETDYWAHHYADNPASHRVEDDEFDVDEMVEMFSSDDWETVINEQR